MILQSKHISLFPDKKDNLSPQATNEDSVRESNSTVFMGKAKRS